MNPELRKTILYLVCLSFIGYSINTALYKLPFAYPTIKLQIPIEYLYIIFSLISISILAVVVIMKKKSFDNVGMTFLILTSVKMGVAFFIGKSIISSENNAIEKINFYGIFAFFLVIETILTIHLLNKKVEK